jgi:hypothetical protein
MSLVVRYEPACPLQATGIPRQGPRSIVPESGSPGDTVNAGSARQRRHPRWRQRATQWVTVTTCAI